VRQEKGDGGGLKQLRCDSDANDNEEKQQEEAISYTNTPSFAAREHASSPTINTSLYLNEVVLCI
jgi:hypothetical protein